MKGMMATGRVQSSHGVKGYLKVESFSGEIRHLLKLRSLVLESNGKEEAFEVEDARKNGKKILLKLKGIDSPEEARRLGNSIVWVERRKAAKRRRKEYYTSDLTGCSVIHENQTVGSVVSVCTTDSETFLEINSASGGQFLLPFNRRYFDKVDIKKRIVTVPENWLLE